MKEDAVVKAHGLSIHSVSSDYSSGKSEQSPSRSYGSLVTHHFPLVTRLHGRGRGVGRGLGGGLDLGVGVGRGVAVGVVLAVAVGVAVGVGVGVGVGVAPPAGAWIATIIGEPVLKKPTVALPACGG